MSEALDKVRTAFANLSSRERAYVGAAVGLALLLVVYLVVDSTSSGGDEAQVRAERAGAQVEVVSRLMAELNEVQGRLVHVEERIAKQGRNLSIRAELEQLAKDSLVSLDAIDPQPSPSGEKYRETKVQVSLKSVTLNQVVKYLHAIESAEKMMLSVKNLRINARSDTSSLLDVRFTVSTFEPV